MKRRDSRHPRRVCWLLAEEQRRRHLPCLSWICCLGIPSRGDTCKAQKELFFSPLEDKLSVLQRSICCMRSSLKHLNVKDMWLIEKEGRGRMHQLQGSDDPRFDLQGQQQEETILRFPSLDVLPPLSVISQYNQQRLAGRGTRRSSCSVSSCSLQMSLSVSLFLDHFLLHSNSAAEQ